MKKKITKIIVSFQACHLYGISLGRKRLKNAIFAVAALKFKKSKG
ncbi:unnamed protein product [Larinioides sclopetarius]|uniref:Uncharacterized protein n=1 Tax=Larinioides sclopetarius TaxID=280406 RepID=A0AAV2BQH5_9ARAC